MNRNAIVLFLSVALIGSVVGYLFLSKEEAPEPAEKSFSLVVEGKKIVSGETTMRVAQGDRVTFTITADEKEEFHVHGYDASVDLEPGIPATLTLVANDTGRFLIELEESKAEIGALEVIPGL